VREQPTVRWGPRGGCTGGERAPRDVRERADASLVDVSDAPRVWSAGSKEWVRDGRPRGRRRAIDTRVDEESE
jgi:hypothetical protein